MEYIRGEKKISQFLIETEPSCTVSQKREKLGKTKLLNWLSIWMWTLTMHDCMNWWTWTYVLRGHYRPLLSAVAVGVRTELRVIMRTWSPVLSPPPTLLLNKSSWLAFHQFCVHDVTKPPHLLLQHFPHSKNCAVSCLVNIKSMFQWVLVLLCWVGFLSQSSIVSALIWTN